MEEDIFEKEEVESYCERGLQNKRGLLTEGIT
jgi:hypothetical protein